MEYTLLINHPSLAEEKTGKYVTSILSQLEKQLGIHVVMFVTYQDSHGDVKISEYVCLAAASLNLTASKGLNPKGYQ